MAKKSISAQALDPADDVVDGTACSHLDLFDLFKADELLEAYRQLPQEARPIFAYMHNGMLEVVDTLLQDRDPVEVFQKELVKASDVNGEQIVECRKLRDFLKEDAAAFEAQRDDVDMMAQRDIMERAVMRLDDPLKTECLVCALDSVCWALDDLGLHEEERDEWHARLERCGLDEAGVERLIAMREDGALWNFFDDLSSFEQEPSAELMEMLRENFKKNLKVDNVIITAENILSTARTLSKNGRQRMAFIHNELLKVGLAMAQGNVNAWEETLRKNMEDDPAACEAVSGQIFESIKAADELRKELKNFNPEMLPDELEEAVKPLAKAFAKHGEQYPVYIVFAHLIRACCRAEGKDDCELLDVVSQAVVDDTAPSSAAVMLSQLFNLLTDEQLKGVARSYEALQREEEDEYEEDFDDDDEMGWFEDAEGLMSDIRRDLDELDFYRTSFIVQATFHAANELLMDKKLSKTFVETVGLSSGAARMIMFEVEPAGEFFLGMPQARIPENRFEDLIGRKRSLSEDEAIEMWLRPLERFDAALTNLEREDARLLQEALYHLGLLAHFMLELPPKKRKRLSKLIEAPFENQAFLFSLATWFGDQSEVARAKHEEYAGELNGDDMPDEDQSPER